MTTTVKCPSCGSTSLLHLHRTLVARHVRRWTVDDNGDVAPAAFSDYPRVLDVASMDNVHFPYQCGNCTHECTASDLVVTRSDGQNPPHAALAACEHCERDYNMGGQDVAAMPDR